MKLINNKLNFMEIEFINTAYAQTIANAPRISEIGFNALQFLLRVFGIIAIIGLVFSGIIYLTAGGNKERIAFAKKSFGYAVVGILIALGSILIVKQIVGLL